jgi:glutamyl-tRNA synthetase
MDIKSVRTRIAPIPLVNITLAILRTCLYDYALAKKFGGQFIIRIEDTDQKRFVEGAQDRIFQVIKDYGLNWDEGPDIGGLTAHISKLRG